MKQEMKITNMKALKTRKQIPLVRKRVGAGIIKIQNRFKHTLQTIL